MLPPFWGMTAEMIPMDDLFGARSTMAFSLGFHIIFASISMVLAFYMAWAHRKYLKDGRDVHLRLTKAWSKGSAVLFATGAVSGTALSFQLGLLWPGFMEHAGPIIGMPFPLEGAAFFLEAILLGWCSAQYPVLLRTVGGNLELRDAGAPLITQLWLVIGMVSVLMLVVPLLVILYRVFDAAEVG